MGFVDPRSARALWPALLVLASSQLEASLALKGAGNQTDGPSSPPPPSVDPSTVTGYTYDLDSSLGVYHDAGVTAATNGQSVQEWHDVSGNAHHVTQATSGFRPIFKTAQVHGNPCISFDGVDDYLKMVSFSFPLPVTQFLVAKQVGWMTSGLVILDGDVLEEAVLFQGGSSPIVTMGSGGFTSGVNVVSSSAWTIGQWMILELQWKLYMGPGDEGVINVNNGGDEVGSGGASTDPDGLTLGGYGFNADFGEGKSGAKFDIARLIGFGAILSDDDRAGVRQWLREIYRTY